MDGEKLEGELTLDCRNAHAKIKDRQIKWNTPVAPKAETNKSSLERFNGAFIEIAQQYPDKKVIVFTHAKAINVVMSSLRDDEDALIRKLRGNILNYRFRKP